MGANPAMVVAASDGDAANGDGNGDASPGDLDPIRWSRAPHHSAVTNDRMDFWILNHGLFSTTAHEQPFSRVFAAHFVTYEYLSGPITHSRMQGGCRLAPIARLVESLPNCGLFHCQRVRHGRRGCATSN